MPIRRTKILATMGPATDDPAVVADLVAAGLNGVRINCSHGTPDDWRRAVALAREAAARADREIAVVFDLQGPKTRLARDTQARSVRRGERVTLVEGAETPEGCMAVAATGVLASVDPTQSEVVVGDGTPRFRVEAVAGRGRSRRAYIRCIRPGEVSPSKGLVVTHARRRPGDGITPKDLNDLGVARECGADFVALSYVRHARDLIRLRAHLAAIRLDARVIAKIETVAAMEALEAVVAASDAVMVARGDLGVEVGVARVPPMQRRIVHTCVRLGRPAIMATQMLESMVTTSEPTRAEATDIATAVIQGSSALMLSAETAVGRYPVEVVRAMAEIAHATEDQESSAPPLERQASDEESVMRAAAALSESVQAAAFVVPTASGASARALAAYRPRAPIVALTHRPEPARQLALEWGVVPSVLPAAFSLDHMIEQAIERARMLVPIPSGAPVVLTFGQRVGEPGSTSLIALRRVSGPSPRRRRSGA